MGSSRTGAVLAFGIALVAAIVSVAATIAQVGSPSTGSVIAIGGIGDDRVRVEAPVGAASDLRTGDFVVSIAGRPIGEWADGLVGSAPRLYPEGGTVAIEVVRDGTTLELSARLVRPAGDVLIASWGTLAFVLSLLAIGAFVFWRRPRVPAAGALLIVGAGAAGSTIPYVLGHDPLSIATGAIVQPWVATAFVYLLLWAGLIDFALVFPRPIDAIARRPVLRLAPYGVVFGSYLGAIALGAATSASTLAWIGLTMDVSLLPTIIAFAALPVIIAYRWRTGPKTDRRLMRGFALVLAFIIVADMLLWVGPELLGAPRILPPTMTGVTGIPFPIVVAGAILRHRAFDIDVVVRRSLVYGGLTVAVVVTYAAVAAGLGAVLGSSSPFASSLLATGVAALLVLPLRDVLQRAVTRLLYGDRDEPVRAIRRLGDRLELTMDPATMPRVVVDTVADALRLPYVGLELGTGPAARLVAERGTRPPPEESIERPLTFHGRPTGRLIAGSRGAADPLSASDLELLGDLARQVGAAAHAANLTVDLRSSRERIVTAREEERRRLRRDLHDNLGPALAGIGMRAEAVEALLQSDPDRATRLLADLRGEVAAAVGDVRRVVDSLRPPAIDEVGLLGALRLAADRLVGLDAPLIRVTADGPLTDLPAAVEVAAYRIASEGMLNAVRHAAASCCDVRLVRGSELTVVVEDDGTGMTSDRSDGVGLRSMHERAAELGGGLRVEAGPNGRGTRIVASLPLTGTVPLGGEP